MLTTHISARSTHETISSLQCGTVCSEKDQGPRRQYFLLVVCILLVFLLAIARWYCVLITVFGPVAMRGQFSALVVI